MRKDIDKMKTWSLSVRQSEMHIAYITYIQGRKYVNLSRICISELRTYKWNIKEERMELPCLFPIAAVKYNCVTKGPGAELPTVQQQRELRHRRFPEPPGQSRHRASEEQVAVWPAPHRSTLPGGAARCRHPRGEWVSANVSWPK